MSVQGFDLRCQRGQVDRLLSRGLLSHDLQLSRLPGLELNLPLLECHLPSLGLGLGRHPDLLKLGFLLQLQLLLPRFHLLPVLVLRHLPLHLGLAPSLFDLRLGLEPLRLCLRLELLDQQLRILLRLLWRQR